MPTHVSHALALLLGLALGTAITAAALGPGLPTPSTPPPAITQVLPPAPVCATPLAQLPGAESLVLRRDGQRIALVVLYDGSVRGALLTADLDRRVLLIPSRPPHGWLIGAR